MGEAGHCGCYSSPMESDTARRYRWAEFEFWPEQRRLLRAGVPVRLERKVLDLLIELVEGGSRARSREELLDRVWAGQVVVDEALTQAVSRLRHALDDGNGEIIETLRGHGYRFNARLQHDAPATGHEQPRTRLRPARASVLLLGLMIAIGVLIMWPEGEVHGERQRIAVLAFEPDDEAQDWIRLGLSAIVADAIPAHHNVDVVPAGTTFDLLDESEHEPLARLRQAAGADYVLGADVARTQSGWELSYRLWHDAGLVWEQTITGRQLHELVDRLNVSLADALDAPRRAQLLPTRLSTIDFVNEAFARGRQARYEGDFRAAAELFEVCIDQDPGLHAARQELADALRRLGRYREAATQAEQVRTSALASGDAALAADAMTTLGLIAWRQGDYDLAATHVREALAIHQSESRIADAAHDQNVLAIILGRRGDHREATQLYLNALASYRSIGDRAGEAKTLNNLGWDAWNRGDQHASLDYDVRALAIQEELGLTSGMALTLNNLGVGYLHLGRINDAHAYLDRALTMRERIGDRAGVVTTLGNLALISAHRGRFDEAEQRVRAAIAQAQDLATPELEAHAQTKLGDVLMQSGDLVASASAFDAALALWEQLGIDRGAAEIQLWRADLALAAGDVEQATGWLPDPSTVEDEALRARSFSLWGRVHREQGNRAAALEHFQDAIDAGRSAGAFETVVRAAIDAAHLCLDLALPCTESFLAPTAGWQKDYAPAAIVNARNLLVQGQSELAVSEFRRARAMAPQAWTSQHEAWLRLATR